MFLIYLFFLGLAIGSFLNVLIDRLSTGGSIRGRSYCDHCHHQLAWYDLIPVISFILLKRKCGYCSKKISFYYPFVELLTGFTFVGIWNLKSEIWNIAHPYSMFNVLDSVFLLKIVFLGIISSLIVMFFSDAKYHIIPDEIQITLLIFSFVFLLIQGFTLTGIISRFLAAILVMLPILFIFLITQSRGMGFGDVKLAINIGFLLGLKNGLLSLYLAFIIGAVVGLILIALRRRGLKSKVAFGPFLILGLLTVLFWQDKVYEVIRMIYGI